MFEEFFQPSNLLTVAISGFGLLSLYIKSRIDAAKSKSESDERAEQIQQNAQTFVQETATRLQEQIFKSNDRYDKLRDEYTNLVAEDAKKETRNSIMQNLYDVVISKYDTALTRIETATQRLHEAELQTRDAKHKKMILEETVDNLMKQVKVLEARVGALEADNQHEQKLRIEAETRADVAEQKIEDLTSPVSKLPAGGEQIEVVTDI